MSRVFLSYSHADERYKELLLTHLSPLLRGQQLHIWTDRAIEAGNDWKVQARQSLRESDLAIVLLSPDYLASQFLYESELPQLLEQRASQGLLIIPILIRPCLWEATLFRSIQVVPASQTAISSLPDAERDKVLVQIVSDIAELLQAVEQRRGDVGMAGRERPVTRLEQDAGFVFISHSSDDYDFAELMKLKLERSGIKAWIDVDRLQVGVDWRQEIDDAIKNAKALIAIMSPEARNSEYVTYEWAFAWGVGTKVLPVMLRATQLHPRLESLQYLDFTNKRARPWQKLISEIEPETA